ncbi:Pentatricopeptide repeat-containing protein [Thalictrum thalictroides]|uniref:Pentatricopeptide repeat-containing protein n=1 Tax=Thalictrum thalictroides TaxID=46969 RepID=A0A7J6X0M8_THATH|nr:Pentatricopeptide repeat-containing protein [Thalictrum thalictroides]
MASFRSSLRHCRLLTTTTTATITDSITSPLTPCSIKAKLLSEREEPDNILDRDISQPASRYDLDLTVQRLGKSRRFSDIEKLIESHIKDPKITEENYFSTLIRSYGMAGMVGQAFTLFNQMEDHGTPRSSVSFNALMSVYNMSKKFDQVPKLFDEIPQKYGFSPDEVSYDILIKSLCELNLYERAFSVLKEMEEKNIEITIAIYTTILNYLYKKEMVDEAEKVWNEITEKGCAPDVDAYKVRVMNAIRGKPEDVLKLIDEMKTKGLKPDITSYNSLISCYCKNDMMEDAQKVYQELEGNGCVPNTATVRLCIVHLCRNGKCEEAYEVFKEGMKNDRIPSYKALKALVDGLMKISEREKVKELITALRERFPDNFYRAWSKVEVELGMSKEDKESSTQKPSAIEVEADSSKGEKSSTEKASAVEVKVKLSKLFV